MIIFTNLIFQNLLGIFSYIYFFIRDSQAIIYVHKGFQITTNMQAKILPVFILITEEIHLIILYQGLKVGLETQ